MFVAVPGVGVLCSFLVLLPTRAWSGGGGGTGGPGEDGSHGELFLGYLPDHLGSTRAVVDMWGNIVETRDYDPFGRTIGHTGDFALKHRFTGQPEREAAGAYDYGARLYEPDWGRFLSPDSYVQSFDSQGLHRDAYVLNQPTSLVDPTGNFVGGAGDGGLGAAIGLASLGYGGGWGVEGEPPRPGSDDVSHAAKQAIYNRHAAYASLRPAIDLLRRLMCLADAKTCQRPEDIAFRIGLLALGELFAKDGYDAEPGAEYPYDFIGPLRPNDTRSPFATDDRVDGLDPVFKEKLGRVLQDLRSEGFQPRVIEGLRTLDQQKQKVETGRSLTLNSKHLRGHAADVIDRRRGYKLGHADPFFGALESSSSRHGLSTGRSWRSFPDPSHVEVP